MLDLTDVRFLDSAGLTGLESRLALYDSVAGVAGARSA